MKLSKFNLKFHFFKRRLLAYSALTTVKYVEVTEIDRWLKRKDDNLKQFIKLILRLK